MGLRRETKLRLKPNKTEVLLVGPDLALGSRHALMLDGAALPLKGSKLWGTSELNRW